MVGVCFLYRVRFGVSVWVRIQVRFLFALGFKVRLRVHVGVRVQVSFRVCFRVRVSFRVTLPGRVRVKVSVDVLVLVKVCVHLKVRHSVQDTFWFNIESGFRVRVGFQLWLSISFI